MGDNLWQGGPPTTPQMVRGDLFWGTIGGMTGLQNFLSIFKMIIFCSVLNHNLAYIYSVSHDKAEFLTNRTQQLVNRMITSDDRLSTRITLSSLIPYPGITTHNPSQANLSLLQSSTVSKRKASVQYHYSCQSRVQCSVYYIIAVQFYQYCI